MGVLVLCYFVFSAPNVLARWSSVAYLPIVAILSAVVCLFAGLLLWRTEVLASLSPRVVVAWNILLAVVLVLAILPHQVPLPADPGAYPFPEPPPTPLYPVPLFFLLLLVPILLIDLMLFAGELAALGPSAHRLGSAFSLAALHLLLMVLAHIFTSTYDYIPVVGSFFRDRFWLVHLVAVLAVVLPVLTLRRPSWPLAYEAPPARLRPGLLTALPLVFVATVAAAGLNAARFAGTPENPTTLIVMAYNI